MIGRRRTRVNIKNRPLRSSFRLTSASPPLPMIVSPASGVKWRRSIGPFHVRAEEKI